MEWINNETIIIGKSGQNFIQESSKLACFDLDGTLVEPISNKKFMKNQDDWKFKYSNVKDKLHELIQHNFRIIIFTNQAGMKTIGIGEEKWKIFFTNFVKKLNINLDVYIATSYDYFRKPFPGLWDIITKDENYYEQSFFCGDACGRESDFSDSDFKFSLNCRLKFITPENLFNQCNKKCEIIPNDLFYIKFDKYVGIKNNEFVSKENDFIIFVGNYASGKTTYYEKNIKKHGYISISEKDIEILHNNKNNNKFVIDDTNLSTQERKIIIERIKTVDSKNKYSIRCLIFICPIGLSMHNSKYRHYITKGKKEYCPDVILMQCKEKFAYPKIEEGFDEIIRHKFSINNDVDLGKYFKYFF